MKPAPHLSVISKPILQATSQQTAFVSAYVQSKAKLTQQSVGLFRTGRQCMAARNARNSTTNSLATSICKARIQWRKTHSLLFKEKPDYAFVLAENGKVQEIKAEYRRIANQIVEEAMIIANICAAQFFYERGKTGIFNTHSGFDKKFLENTHHFLMANLANEQNQTELAERYSVENLAT